MRKIISAALFAMAVSVPAFAMDNDQETRMEQAKKEMRAMEDKHMQERRAVEDECHSKMKAMHERHQKEREELKAKYGIGKNDKEGKGGREGKQDRGNREEKGGY